MKALKVLVLLVGAAWLIGGAGWAQTANDKEVQAYFDLMRKDLRTEKQAVVDKAMELETAQKSAFWAIYSDYETALDKVWDQRLINIKKFADTFDKMTDQTADQLAVKMIDLEAQRAALRKKYYGLYKDKMGARTAARFLQVESILAYLIDLQLAAEIPFIQ